MFLAVPVLLFAGAAAAQQEGRPDPKDPRAKAPPVEYRSAFEGYRPYTEPELRDWRKSNEIVGTRQSSGAQATKPQPDKPETDGHGEHK
jgi:hypothetical protein